MAWSEAARAAALEARKLHAGEKKNFRFLPYTPTNKTDRTLMAQAIRRMRAGTQVPDKELMRKAANSTVQRNIPRLRKGMRAMMPAGRTGKPGVVKLRARPHFNAAGTLTGWTKD